MPVNSFDDYPMSWRPQLLDRRPPIYTRLARQLAQDIQAGVLRPGDKLPPQRELADFLDLHLSTITRTYKLCEEQGLICAKVGQGTFVASDVNVSDILLYAQGPVNCIQMGTILPPYNGNEKVVDFIRGLMAQPDIQAFLEYGSPAGTYMQRKTFQTLLEKMGVRTRQEHILFATGSQNALCAAIWGAFRSGDRIGTTSLSFSGLKTIAKMTGIQLIPLPEKEGHLCTKELEQFCRKENLKGIYLVPDQNNPTTCSLSSEERALLGEVAKRFGLIIIEDAINYMFSEEAHLPIFHYAPHNTVYIFSVSKFLSAGLRVACMISPETHRERIENALYSMNLLVSPLSLEIVHRILNSSLLEELLVQKRKELRERNAIADELLTGYQLQGEPTCCFRWLLLPCPWDGQSFEKAAKKAGVQVFCAQRFVVGKTPPPKAVRICISAPRDQDELRKGLERIREVLQHKETAALPSASSRFLSPHGSDEV